MSLLDSFVRAIQNAGAAMTGRAALNFIGFTIADDPGNNRINIAAPTLASFAGGAPPAVARSSAAGVAASFSSSDHTHADPLKGAPGTNLTDADETVTIAQGSLRILPAGLPLTGNRRKTLSTSGAVVGDAVVFDLRDTTAFTVQIINGGVGAGTLYTKSGANCSALVWVQFDGTNWALRNGAIGCAFDSAATPSVACMRDGSGNCSFVTMTSTTAAVGAIQATAATLPINDSGGALCATLGLAHLGAGSLTWAPGVTGVTYGQTQAAAGAGGDTTIAPQLGSAGNATGNLNIPLGPNVGGFTSSVNFSDSGTVFGRIRKSDAAYLRIEGQNTYGLYLNAPSSTAVLTGNAVQISPSLSVTTNSNLLQLQDSQSGLTYFELSRPASGQRVTWLNVGGNGSATKMPANTGDGVSFIGNAATEPTANCDNTGIIPYAFAARLRTRDTYGVRSELGFTGSTGGATVTNKDSFRRQASLKSSVNGTTATILQIPAADWPLAKKFVANVHWTVQGYDETNNSVYCAEYRSTIKGIDGTNCAVQTGGTGATLIGSADDGTAGDVGATPFNVARDGSNNINTTITTIKGDTVVWSVWADVKIVSDT